MDVTAKKSVSAGRRTDVVAELAVRPPAAPRSLATGRPGAGTCHHDARAYLRTTHLPAYTTRRWEVTGRTPHELFDGALAELERPEAEQGNPDAWRNRLELAALAQYHLTACEALKRDPIGNTGSDGRSPQEILGLMLQDKRGLRLLRQRHYYGHSGGVPSGQPLNNSFIIFPEFNAVQRIVQLCPEHILTRALGCVVSAMKWPHGARFLVDR